MLPFIKKIIHSTHDKLYLLFDDETIKVLDVNSYKHLPDWQFLVIKENWEKAKIVDGDIAFSDLVEIGADTVRERSKDITKSDFINIIEQKRISKKKLIEFLSLL